MYRNATIQLSRFMRQSLVTNKQTGSRVLVTGPCFLLLSTHGTLKTHTNRTKLAEKETLSLHCFFRNYWNQLIPRLRVLSKLILVISGFKALKILGKLEFSNRYAISKSWYVVLVIFCIPISDITGTNFVIHLILCIVLVGSSRLRHRRIRLSLTWGK